MKIQIEIISGTREEVTKQVNKLLDSERNISVLETHVLYDHTAAMKQAQPNAAVLDKKEKVEAPLLYSVVLKRTS